MKRVVLIALVLVAGCFEDKVTTPIPLLNLGGLQPEQPSPPPPGEWTGHEPELPRVLLDTRMPVMHMSGDTLYMDTQGVWHCVGKFGRCDSADGGRTILVGAPSTGQL